MASSSEVLRSTGMSYGDAVALAQKAVEDPNSQIYQHLRNALSSRLAALRDINEKKKLMGRKRRLVLPSVLEPEQVHKLQNDYREYDVVCKQSEKVSAGLARSVYHVTAEKLFDNVRGKWANVVAYGMSLNHIIMQNRHWVHLCISSESVDVAARSVRDDRAMCAVLNAARKKNKTLPMTDMYARGDLSKLCCSDAVSCKVQASIGVMMLMNVDTNYKQLCTWMLQHGVKLLYFAFPCVKATEMRYDADIPELGARVVHEGDKFHILYKNATSMGQTYTYSNHLSLIGKSYEVIGDRFFFKEYTGHLNGVSFYKVTMAKHKYPVDDMVYRSWTNVGYQKRYLVQSFELRNNVVDIFDPRSYSAVKFEVDRDAMDKLIEYAMGLEKDVFDHNSIARRLRSYMTTTVHSGYSIVNGGLKLDDAQFSHVVLAVYTMCFMKRFVSGVTLRFMTGQDVDLRYLRECGAVALIPYTLAMFVRNGIVAPVKKFFGMMRIFFDKWFGSRRVAIPTISLPESFIEYKDTIVPDIWTEVKSWFGLDPKPTVNFSPYLPGFSVAMSAHGISELFRYNTKARRELIDSMQDMWRSDIGAYVSGGPVKSNGAPSNVQLSKKNMEDLAAALGVPVEYETDVLMIEEEVPRGPTVEHVTVDALVSRVMDGHEDYVDTYHTVIKAPVVFDAEPGFTDSHNGTVDDPLAVLSVVMGKIFPESTLMQTDSVSSDIHYGSMEIVARAVRIKLDASKLNTLRPERIFRPKLPNQTLPNAKQTMQAVLPTVVKRNLNTTSSVDPLDADELWERTWKFMKEVYYVKDVDERLLGMEQIMPTVETVAVWASKLDETARERAVTTKYAIDSLYGAMQNSQLMLKAKRKTNLGPSFDTAVKAAQSIQFDPSKARTGVFSPIFAEKVRRDKSVLRDNVFIMQSKSPDDLNKFLSAYRWNKPNVPPLRYLEMDAEMFDKSQVFTTLMMHWKKCEKFGVMPSYVQLLKDGVTYRSASSIQAGIKVFITPQRGSGDSDTLDGNCDVSQAAYARFFSRILSQIEFILIMGDDVTVAVRGEVDFESVEADCMREFNLSVKLTDSEFGYFVSGWLVHMPDGTINWRTDPVKRAVSLGDQSVTENVDLHERYVGFNDLCRGLEGYATQNYMAQAIAARYGKMLDVDIQLEDVIDMTKSVVTLATDYGKYRNMFAAHVFKRSA